MTDKMKILASVALLVAMIGSYALGDYLATARAHKILFDERRECAEALDDIITIASAEINRLRATPACKPPVSPQTKEL